MSKRMGFRVLLIGMLLCVSVGWAASTWDQRRLESELTGIAEDRVAFYREVADVVDGGDPKFDLVSVVTVTREFGLIGSPSGKVTIYQRSHEPTGHGQPSKDMDMEHEKESDMLEENDRYFSGIQYFYEKVDGEWLNTESGQCSSEECQTVGREAFQRAGI